MQGELIKELENVSNDSPSDVLDKRGLNVEEQRVRIKGISQNIEERKKYACYLFWLMVVYLVLTFGLLYIDGFRLLDFYLSDSVLIALITTTTANVIALFVLVVKYLFPSH